MTHNYNRHKYIEKKIRKIALLTEFNNYTRKFLSSAFVVKYLTRFKRDSGLISHNWDGYFICMFCCGDVFALVLYVPIAFEMFMYSCMF